MEDTKVEETNTRTRIKLSQTAKGLKSVEDVA